MGNAFCSKADDDFDTTSSPLATSTTQEYQDERNAAVITAGINQLKSASPYPLKYFSGDTFDSLSLDKRLTFFPAHTETVLYSSSVTKTNRRGKEQNRIWVLTDQAFYNFEVNNYSSCKRRIALSQIKQVFVNSASTQLLIRVPKSYDYLCSTDTTGVNAFVSILVNQAPKATPKGSCMYIPCVEQDISNRCVTKGSDTGKTWKVKRGRVR